MIWDTYFVNTKSAGGKNTGWEWEFSKIITYYYVLNSPSQVYHTGQLQNFSGKHLIY